MAKRAVSLADMQQEMNVAEQAPPPELTIVEPSAPSTRPRTAAKDEALAQARTFKRVGLYLHPVVKREIDTIAFTHEQKPHDLYLEAIDLILRQYGRPSIKQLEKK